jgi:hypothetical protein
MSPLVLKKVSSFCAPIVVSEFGADVSHPHSDLHDKAEKGLPLYSSHCLEDF